MAFGELHLVSSCGDRHNSWALGSSAAKPSSAIFKVKPAVTQILRSTCMCLFLFMMAIEITSEARYLVLDVSHAS